MPTDDLQHLRRSFVLAAEARDGGNHPFGAVLVDAAGRVLAEGRNTVVTGSDCTGHAELNLARDASQRFTPDVLAGATMYCSTEPCAMCAGALHWLGIARIVFGLRNARMIEIMGSEGALERLELPVRDVLARSGRSFTIVGPLLEDEAESVHR